MRIGLSGAGGRVDNALQASASTRDHFPCLIEPPGHRAFQLPQYFHRPFRLMTSVMGTTEAVVRKGFAPAIPFAFTHEQDDVRALCLVLATSNPFRH